MAFFDSAVNLFNNSSVGKIINGSNSSNSSGWNYAQTTYATDFTPQYIETTGQKRFQTKTPIMNLPKTETMFFVYFSLNPKTHDILQKRKAIVDFLVKETCGDTPLLDNEKENLASKLSKKFSEIGSALKSSVSSMFNEKLSSLGLNKKKEDDDNSQPIETEDDSKSYGDYIPEKYVLNQLSFELSKFVKEMDKPSIDFTVTEYNEYNRKRLCYDSMKFKPITITFYDVKDNPVEQFFFTYLKIISNDFLAKDFNNYKKKIVTNDFDYDVSEWGFDVDSNFRLIDKISFCEYYMDKMMVYTMENPVIQSINFGKGKVGSFSPSTITVTFGYEGLTNDLLDVNPYNVTWNENKTSLKSMINRDISANMAAFLNVRYKAGTSMGVDTAVSFIKGVLDAPAGERWDVIKSQTLDTARKLGFSQEVDIITKAKDTIEGFKNSDNKGKFLLKMTDDPSSIVGQITTGGSTSSSSSFLKSFT